jgi:hypothetical protein
MSFYKRATDEVGEYGESIRHGMVADRGTLQEVQDYCMQYNAEERLVAMVIFHMTLNTVANNLQDICTPTKEENTL